MSLAQEAFTVLLSEPAEGLFGPRESPGTAQGSPSRLEAEVQRLERRQQDGQPQLAVGQLDLGSKRSLRPTEKGGEHLSGLIAVIVDGLLAHDNKIRLLFINHSLQKLCDAQRLNGNVGLDVDGVTPVKVEVVVERIPDVVHVPLEAVFEHVTASGAGRL